VTDLTGGANFFVQPETNDERVNPQARPGSNQDDFNVLEDGVVVGRIFKSPGAPQDRQWMWASGHSATTVARAAHGYEPTRKAAMAAFARSWRRKEPSPKFSE
jgi:hypothetical protein